MASRKMCPKNKKQKGCMTTRYVNWHSSRIIWVVYLHCLKLSRWCCQVSHLTAVTSHSKPYMLMSTVTIKWLWFVAGVQKCFNTEHTLWQLQLLLCGSSCDDAQSDNSTYCYHLYQLCCISQWTGDINEAANEIESRDDCATGTIAYM